MQKLLLAFLFLLLMAFSKKSEDVAPTEIPERLEISVANKSVKISDTARFNVLFYDKLGNKITPPTNILWSSSNTNIAEINQNGIATGKNKGQTTIKASYKNLEADALLTVVSDNKQVATVTLESIREIRLNETSVLQATVKNVLGEILSGYTVSWQSDNSNVLSIDAIGKVTGLAYGTANIRATVEGIQSNAAMVQVIRSGNFANGSTGTGKLKIENGVLRLQTSSNFSASSSPPDLRMYLSNNTNNVNDALEIATLNQRNGAQTWNIPSNVSITQYRYILVWCKQFGGVYGRADLGE